VVRRVSTLRPPDEPAPKEPTFSPGETPTGSPLRRPKSSGDAEDPDQHHDGAATGRADRAPDRRRRGLLLFGINDLTQKTWGFSRDDVESSLFAADVDKGVFTISPFETIDADTLTSVPREGALSSTPLPGAVPERPLAECQEALRHIKFHESDEVGNPSLAFVAEHFAFR